MKVIHFQGPNRMFQTHVSPASSLKKVQNYVFDLSKVLGVGNFSKVYHGSHQLTNQTCAIKVVEMERMKTSTLSNLLKSECEILQSLKHPNVLNCVQIFNSKNNCYIITELCNDGDLESLIRKRGPLDENSAKKIIWETFSGLRYLNEMRIIHRDFKVANVFMNDGIAKIADFGFAKRLKYPEEVFTDVNIGSPIYMSPESLLYHRYGAKTDIWAFGVFLYEILHGDTPLYFCKSETDLKMNIGIPIKDSAFSPYLSAQLKNLIARCLDVDEKRRISMAEMVNHPYIIHLKNLFQQRAHSLTLKVSQSTNASVYNIPEARSKIVSYGNGYPSEPVNLFPSVSHRIEPPSPSKAVSIQWTKESSETKSPNRILRHKLDEPKSSVSDHHLSVRSQSLDRTPAIIHNALRSKISTPVEVPQENYYTPKPPQYLNTQPSQITSISSQSNVNVTPSNNSLIEIQPTQIINSSITFAQCVHILHYCRLIYKCLMMAQKLNCYLESDTFLVNWLLSLLREIKNKQNTVRIEGDRASVREKKLKDVINEYQSKYVKELQHYIAKNPNLSPSFIKEKLKTQIVVLCQRWEMEGDEREVNEEVRKMMAYLDFLRECTEMLCECVREGDFGKFGVMRIEDFLTKIVDGKEVDFARIRAKALM